MIRLKSKILQKIFKQPGLGLLPKKVDPKNFNVGFLWFGFKYTPEHTRKVLDLKFPAKDQEFNTCGWTSLAGAKECIDEKIELDERTLVMFGMREGCIRGDGFSNLKDNEKMLQKFGIAEKGILNTGFRTWKEYSDPSLLTPNVIENAQKYRSESYWEIDYASQAYKAIDDGRYVKIGIDWKTSMNMKDGFKLPWILNFIIGYLVGGHAMYIYGYDQKYNNKRVFLVRNSFGAWWGQKGDCYIEEGDLQKQINKYGAWVNLDIKSDVGKFLMENDGKNIKGTKSPAIYHIQNGKKKPYIDWVSFLAWDGKERGFTEVPQRVLDQVEEGDIMDITKSIYWKFLKDVKEDKQLDKLMELIYKNN